MKKINKYINKGARTYLKSAVKAASHPVRSKILKTLKAGAMSTPDLEEAVGENRYNLYHHLDVLIGSDLIHEIDSGKKSKYYQLNMPKKPNVAVFIFTDEDFKKDFSTWNKMLDGLEKIEGERIPIRGKIIQAEIHLSYK
jgi:DNA-binding transcriptional ArsR family regulator